METAKGETVDLEVRWKHIFIVISSGIVDAVQHNEPERIEELKSAIDRFIK